MKILHVIDSGGLYGAESMLLTLTEEQRQLGHDPVILSIGTPNESEKPLESEAIRRGLSVCPWRMRAGLNLIGGYRILRYAQDGGFDVLHSHGYKGNILLGIFPYRFRQLPLVSTLHGWTSLEASSRMAIYQWLDCRMLRRSNAVVLVSPLMKNDARIKICRIANIQTICNGISIQEGRIADVDLTIKKFCDEGFIVGTVGRLSPEKGIDVLIDAMAVLSVRHPDMKAVLLGEGPSRAALEKKISDAGLTDKILLPGFRRDAKNYMRYFDVFVLPSLTEGLPIVLLEAMASRVPVVAASVGGVPEVIGRSEYGLLVEPNDSTGLVNAVDKVYTGEIPVYDLVNRAYQRLHEHYSSKQMAVSYLALYRDVVFLVQEEGGIIKSNTPK